MARRAGHTVAPVLGSVAANTGGGQGVIEVHGEQVRLVLPTSPHLLRVARLTAAGLAGRLGFSFDEIEDVKIAVDELCFALVGARGRSGSLAITYTLEIGALAIEGVATYESAPPELAPTELSSQILAAVVDEHELAADDDRLRFRLVKRRAEG
jgi:serine/threonine-protein kinase RsbW